VLFRSGEKKILKFLMDTTQKIIPLFDMDFKVIFFNFYRCIIECKKNSSLVPRVRTGQRLSQ